MSWANSLSTRLNDLPLVLAGPILRRTEKTNVSVWLALKEDPGPMTLNIYYESSPTAVMSSQDTRAIKLGEMLYVVLLTASSTTELSSGSTYQYDIIFGGGSWIDKKLEDPGVLNSASNTSGSIGDIAYTEKGINRPSFSLPPNGVNDLRIIHASCRKPHGGEYDALKSLVDMISEKADQPDHRPHQLYLTGDQIYADDVADILLYMINDAEPHIIGWNETVPDVNDINKLKPGFRDELLRDTAKFSVDEGYANSHLIKLSEFYLMYLMVWSPVLWVNWKNISGGFPTWEEVFPDSDSVSVINNNTEILYSLELPAAIYVNHHPDYKRKEKFVADSTQTVAMANSLFKVRRALANVPTYMMWDDHDVTDDWFIDYAWCRDTLHSDNKLGRRIIANGMSSFAIFQAWGNDPTHPQLFLSSGVPSITILKSLNDLATQPATDQPAIFNNIENVILPKLRNVTNFGQNGSELYDSPDFNFYIRFDYFLLVALDSRTKRFFPHPQLGVFGMKKAPALLSETAIFHQLDIHLDNGEPPSGILFTLLLAPAPIIGHSVWERSIQTTLIFPVIPPYLNPISRLTYFGFNALPPRVVDREAWYNHKACFEAILEKLSHFNKVVILSGDVHYGFSADVTYWNDRNPTSPKVANFVQLTASALKNSDWKTKFIAGGYLPQGFYIFNPSQPIFLPMEMFAVGWQTEVGSNLPGRKSKLGNLQQDKGENNWVYKRIGSKPPYVFEFNTDSEAIRINPNRPPEWRYRVGFKLDNRTSEVRGTYLTANDEDPYNPPTDYYEWLNYQKIRNEKWDKYTMAVGADNIAEVTFNGVYDTFNNFNINVIQALWYSSKKDTVASILLRPLTVHADLRLYQIPYEPLPNP